MRTSSAPGELGPNSERGMTLVELMVAIMIGLFLTGGLLTLVQAMKRTTVNQSGLSQLQDNERMAMTLITDVIKSTGYYSNPLLNTAVSSFPVVNYNANANFTYAGQALVGTGAYAAGTNVVTSRYATTGADNIINCTGNTSAVAATFVNTFSLDGNGNLQCTLIVNGGQPTTVPLISGIQKMQIYYGVQTNGAAGTNSVDTYMDAASVTAAGYWNSVKSVQVTLWFVNPMFGQPGQTNANLQTIPFTRVIAVMDKNGVTT
ncbi:MAG: PilW family protein [Steroidobacteraceae bacterium]